MKIVVLVKQVPDSGAERNLRSDDNTVDRASANNVINEMDEYAIEEALKLKEAHGGEVTILTMGPDRATESIRKALSMGPDKAVHVVDDALHGSCALATSKVLAAAARARSSADLVICGAESTDARGQVLPHMLAERLGVAALTGARKLTVDGSTLTIERQTEEGYEVVTASTPGRGLASGTPSTSRATPRSRGSWRPRRSRCRRCRWPTWASPRARSASPARPPPWSSTAKRPPRSGGTRVTDEGEGGVEAGRVPRLREVRLRGGRWLRFWFWSSPPGGKVKKVTLEALTIARGLGEPSRGRGRRARHGRGADRQARRVRRGEGLRRPSPTSSTATWSTPEGGGAGEAGPRRRRRRPCSFRPLRRARRSPAGWPSSSTTACSPTWSALDADGTATQVVVRRLDDREVEGVPRASRW